MSLSFFIGSDLYNAGYTEDGDPFIAESLHVIAETKEGRRFRHVKQFKTTEASFEEDDEGFGHTIFPDLREEANGAAAILLDQIEAHIALGCHLDRTFWFETDPRYGSEAYQQTDVEDVGVYFIVKQEF